MMQQIPLTIGDSETSLDAKPSAISCAFRPGQDPTDCQVKKRAQLRSELIGPMRRREACAKERVCLWFQREQAMGVKSEVGAEGCPADFEAPH